jgi:hypothetical protein
MFSRSVIYDYRTVIYDRMRKKYAMLLVTQSLTIVILATRDVIYERNISAIQVQIFTVQLDENARNMLMFWTQAGLSGQEATP